MKLFKIFCITLFLFLGIKYHSQAQCYDCLDSDVLTFYVDLSSTPDTIWTSPTVSRSGVCCSSPEPPCIRFIVYLNPLADEFSFQMADGATPPGMQFLINCTDTFNAGEPICVPSSDSLCIVYCKPGANANSYEIATARNIYASPDMTISMGCTGMLTIEGIQESSITWNSIYPGLVGDYNSYLSCTSGCDTTYVTPSAGYPDSVIFVGQGTPTGCSTTSSSDTVVVHFVPGMTVTIDPSDPAVCFGASDAQITANVTGGAPPYSYLWSTGDTTQSISVGQGTYWVDVSDTTAGCPSQRDSVTVIAHLSAIIADAGADQIVCITSPDVTLNGTIDVATGGTWSGGTGTFNPDANTLNAIYTPSAAEISAGTVTLTLTSTGNGGCPPASDDMTITISPTPVVDAGANQIVCSDSPDVSLSGSVTVGGTTGQWSTSGDGTFNNDTNLNATYSPGANDISNGSVSLYLTSTDGCEAVTDTMIVTISPTPIVNAGADQTVCANNSIVSLSGSITGGGSAGQWTTSGDGSFSNDTDLNATYTPGPNDITNGTATITLTSTDGCATVLDNMAVTITPAPVVDAGTDQTVCAVNPNVTLSGSVTGGTITGQWTTSGDGFFDDNTNLNAIYTPGPNDISNGSVTLTLTSTGNGNCIAVSDQMTITITPAPIVNAGSDQTVCANDADVALAGTIAGGATAGQWTTSGDGLFSNNTDLNATTK